MGLVIASAIALVSCQKENHPSKFELRAEGFSSGNKMAVNAFTSTWSNGDQVRIGNTSYIVSAVPRGAGLCRQWQHNIESFMLWEDEFDQQVEEYNQRDGWLSDGDGFWN